MKYKKRSSEQIDGDIRTAGQSFFGLHIEDMLNRILELDDRNSKTKVIEEYYDNQIGFYDKRSSGTRVRVNSVIRIIKANQVKYALEKIDGKNPGVNLEAVKTAKFLLKQIDNNQFTLPKLD